MLRVRKGSKYIKKELLNGYKRRKYNLLRQFGYHGDIHIFDKATSEIQVDNIALDFIMSV